MASPPSPDKRHDLASRPARLRADALAQGVGHAGVIERTEQPALPVHAEIARAAQIVGVPTSTANIASSLASRSTVAATNCG